MSSPAKSILKKLLTFHSGAVIFTYISASALYDSYLSLGKDGKLEKFFVFLPFALIFWFFYFKFYSQLSEKISNFDSKS